MDVARIVGAIAAVAAAAALIVPAASARESCENEARRTEQASTFLSDCRAYELITPTGSPPITFTYGNAGLPPLGSPGFNTFETGRQPKNLPPSQITSWPAVDGDAALYQAYEPSSQSDEESSSLVRRGPSGWAWENVAPPQSRHAGLCNYANWVGASRNLEQVAFADGYTEGPRGEVPQAAEECGHDEPRLVEGEPEDAANLFLRDTATEQFQLVSPIPTEGPQHDPFFDAISADGSHVVFQSRARLAPDAPLPAETGNCPPAAGEEWREFGDVYVWSAGAVRLLTVLPERKAVLGTLAGAHPKECYEVPPQSARFTHSVSADGERILFYSGGNFIGVPHGNAPVIDPSASYRGGGLYLREHADAEESAAGECTKAEQEVEPDKACTIRIDVPEAGAPSGAKAGEGNFEWANAETTRIFFTDDERLTANSPAATGEPDLYEYDLEKPEGERLTDLTVNGSEPADVLGVAGVSEEGSYVYFAAQGDLTGGQENSHGAKAQAGKANLYLRHAGATTFIATLDAERGDRCDWTAACLTSRVSANGAYIGFDSIDPLTGYDNQPVQAEACEPITGVAGSSCMETYRYSAADGPHGELTCASCDPEGKPPAAKFAWSIIEYVRYYSKDLAHGPTSMQLAPNVSDSGQVYFDTMEALVEIDKNKTWDVYEYAGGEGASAQLHLISTGTSEEPSYFLNATPDGDNVFFITSQSLLLGDIRADYDLYDARVGGGFATQNEPIQPPACEGEGGCRSPLTEPPAQLSVASAALFGPGNLVPMPEQHEPEKPAKCKKGFVRKHGKCVRNRHRKRHHGKHPNRQIRHNRRAGK